MLKNQRDKGSFKFEKVAAFTAIYIIWGTTYLAIRLAIETIPPFLMAGMRFTIAGILFYSWCYWRFEKKPGLKEWGTASIPGILMFVGGNGSLTWSEQFIPSGLAALIISTIPIWMVLLSWAHSSVNRPDGLTLAGIVIGLAGVALLTGLDEKVLIGSVKNSGSVPLGILVLTFAAISWAAGSIYSKNLKSSVSLQFTISMQILAGGLVLILIGFSQGEWSEISIHKISFKSILAMSYLILFGSLITYSAYIWLLQVSTPAKVGTYAFFNPLVAVFLGWLFVDETITLETVIGAGCILLSILLVNKLIFRRKKTAKLNEPEIKNVIKLEDLK
jgi:drug/metabolite transporter (DMT)-like permease